MDICTGLQRQQTQMVANIKSQDLEISGLKARVKLLKDKDRGSAEPSQEDALIKGRSMEIGEEVGVERSTELGIATTVGVSTVGVPTVSGLFPTVSAIFTTASVVTPYSRRLREISAKDKGKEKEMESEVPKKRKLQEQIDAQVAREIEEEFAGDNQRLSEQLARDFEIARLHAEKELKMMIDGLDRSNEIIAKHLQEYEQAAVELSIGEKIELINELVKHPIIDWEIHFEGQREYWKIIRLEGVMGRAEELFEPDFEDQLWTHNQAFMHDPLEWKLYDTCGVHHVFTKDQEIFMLVEKDYPLRKGLATVMICNKLQVKQYSQMANHLILKIHNIANTPR
nr:hypothetical protein [Tanacetum cinerariifolium]